MVIGTFEAAASDVEAEFEFVLATEFVTEGAFALLTGAEVFEFGVVGVHPTNPSERMNNKKPVAFDRAQLFLVRI
jgi:hypothetical protein